MVSSVQPLSTGYNDAWFITPASTGNADRANYNEQQHPGSHFLDVKGKLQSQEMPAAAGELRILVLRGVTVPGLPPWTRILKQDSRRVCWKCPRQGRWLSVCSLSMSSSRFLLRRAFCTATHYLVFQFFLCSRPHWLSSVISLDLSHTKVNGEIDF